MTLAPGLANTHTHTAETPVGNPGLPTLRSSQRVHPRTSAAGDQPTHTPAQPPQARPLQGLCRDSGRTLQGLCRDSGRTLQGLWRDSAGTQAGLCRDSAGTLAGLCRDSGRTLEGFCRDSGRNLQGLCRDSGGTLQGQPQPSSSWLAPTGTRLSWAARQAGASCPEGLPPLPQSRRLGCRRTPGRQR